MAINPLIIDALKKLNPTLPANDGEYVDREWEGMARGWDVMERLEVLIAAEHTVRGVLHGPIGVGKTTELRRWARGLAGVANVQIVTVGRPSQPLRTEDEISGFLAESIRVAVIGKADEVLKSQWEVRLSVFERKVSGRERLRDTLAQAGLGRSGKGKSNLLLVDGLDLLANDQSALFGAAQNLPLDELPSVVFVGAHPWFTLTPREQRDPRLDSIWELPCFAVQAPDGTPNDRAIDTFAAGLYKRLAPVEGAFWDLSYCCFSAALHSGGVPRDAIRILHSAVLSAAKSGKVNAANLSQGLNELRQDIAQSLSSDELLKVAKVGKSLNHEGELSLISKNAILPYDLPDRRYWLPHPVLRNLIGAPRVF